MHNVFRDVENCLHLARTDRLYWPMSNERVGNLLQIRWQKEFYVRYKIVSWIRQPFVN